MGRRRVLLLACLSLALSLCSADDLPESLVVQTTAGGIRGKWSATSTGRAIAAFEGVPFAQPPIGELRFQPPVPAAPWVSVRDADQPGQSCPQTFGTTVVLGSEDCLYLNVYAPETLLRPVPLPVMVYIHGGAFLNGNGYMYGPEYLLNRDVVFVNINYRLGPLGFLSTADDVILGNAGLKDQLLALRWVKDNILKFGGDPNLITIFGESAGAASVHYLTLSPLSKGLFQRAALMSGSALAPWAFDAPSGARRVAERLAAKVDCPTAPSTALRECLMAKSAAALVLATDSLATWGSHPIVPFKPTVEPAGPGAFINRHPIEAYANGQASDVPMLAGVLSHEGCIVAVPILENATLLEDLDQRFVELSALIYFTERKPQSANEAAYTQLRSAYFGEEKITAATSRPKLVDLYSDAFFTVSAQEMIKQQKRAAKSAVFSYVLEHYANRTFSKIVGGKDNSCGMCHADDLIYVFPVKVLFPEEPTAADRAFSDKLVHLLTTFAAEGRPTLDDSWGEVRDAEHAEYAHVTGEGALAMRSDFAHDRVQRWHRLPFNMAVSSPQLTKDEL